MAVAFFEMTSWALDDCNISLPLLALAFPSTDYINLIISAFLHVFCASQYPHWPPWLFFSLLICIFWSTVSQARHITPACLGGYAPGSYAAEWCLPFPLLVFSLLSIIPCTLFWKTASTQFPHLYLYCSLFIKVMIKVVPVEFCPIGFSPFLLFVSLVLNSVVLHSLE